MPTCFNDQRTNRETVTMPPIITRSIPLCLALAGFVFAGGWAAPPAVAQLDALLGTAPKVREVSAADLRAMQSKQQELEQAAKQENQAVPSPSFVIVDVRSEPEYRVSVLPGAIPAKQFEANREDYADRTIITYCTSGYRSERYAKKLMQDPDLKVFNFSGSILAWCEAGYPLETLDRKPTKRVHTNSPKHKVPDQYEPVN